MSTETKPPLKADAFGGGLCLVRERGFRVLGEGAGLQAGLALLLLGGHENAQIMLGQKDLGEHGNAGIQAEAIPQNPQGGAVAQVEGVQGQDILPVLPDQVEIGPLVLGCLIRQLVIDRVKQVCGLLAGPGVAGAVDGLIQHLLGDQAGQGVVRGSLEKYCWNPVHSPCWTAKGRSRRRMSLCFSSRAARICFCWGVSRSSRAARAAWASSGGTVLPWASSVFWEQERSFVSRSSVKMACFILSSSASTFI